MLKKKTCINFTQYGIGTVYLKKCNNHQILLLLLWHTALFSDLVNIIGTRFSHPFYYNDHCYDINGADKINAKKKY